MEYLVGLILWLLIIVGLIIYIIYDYKNNNKIGISKRVLKMQNKIELLEKKYLHLCNIEKQNEFYEFAVKKITEKNKDN